MPIERYRSIEDMPPPWKDADDPGNLRRVAMMLALHQRLVPRHPPGVYRFRSIEEAKAARDDFYRRANPELIEKSKS